MSSLPHEPPLSFERVGRAKTAGCLAYLLILPVFALIGAIAVSSAAYGLARLLGGGELIESRMILAGMVIGVVGSGYAGIRLYLREAGHRIVVHGDRLEWHRTGGVDPFPYEDIEWMEGPSLTALKMKVRRGRVITFRAEEWPAHKIGEALRSRMVPVMVRCLNARLASGETIPFCPANHLALRYLATGTFFITFGALLFYYWWEKIRIEKTFKLWGVPSFMIGVGLTAIVQVGRARSGVMLSAEGIHRRPSEPALPWPMLRDVVEDQNGATFRFEGGATASVGLLARNYAACVAMARERLSSK